MIDEDIAHAINQRSQKRIPSALKLILVKANQFQLRTKREYNFKTPSPPWLTKPESIIMDLAQYRKNNTNHSIFQALFSNIASELLHQGWKFFYTDGSKTPENTSFAVTQENGLIVKIGILPNFASIFTAEAFGILQAITIASKLRGKTIICSDSISV